MANKPFAKFITTFKGTLPCADCPGIVTEIKLNSHTVTYEKKDVYMVRNDTLKVTGSYNTERGYKKDKNATIFILDDDKPGSEKRFLKLNDNTLLMLGSDGEIIDTTSKFKLYKVK